MSVVISAGTILGGQRAYSASGESLFDFDFSVKNITADDKPGKIAGKFLTNDGDDTHSYSLQHRIFGPSQFGVTSPFMAKNGDMVFTIYRRFPFGPATCDYKISDGTGVLDRDYAALDPLNGTLNFADREIHKTITIATMADGAVDKTVICTLGATSGSFIENEHIGTGTIMEPTRGIYYFDATLGNDSNGGSIFRPKKTWAALEAALKNAGPGDAFLFKRGETFTTNQSLIPNATKGGGKDGNPIIVGAYGDFKKPAPIIDKDGSDGELPFIRFINALRILQNITLQDIRFTSSFAPGNRPGGVFMLGNPNTDEIIDGYRLERLEVDNLQAGLRVDKSKRLNIKFCHVHHNFGIAPERGHTNGMYAHGSDGMVVEYNLFHNNGKTGSIFDWQIYIQSTTNGKTRWNIMRDGPNIDKFRGDVNYEVRGNIFSDGGVSGGGGGGDSSKASYSVSSNIVYAQNYKRGKRLLFTIGEASGDGTWVPGEMMDGCDVYSNIFHAEGDYPWLGVIMFGDNSPRNVNVFNNLIISSSVNWMISTVAVGYVSYSVKNNIFIRSGTLGKSDTIRYTSLEALADIKFSGNIYYNNVSADIVQVKDVTNYSDLATFQAAYPSIDVGSIEIDPLIADIDGYDYRLQLGSPAIGLGSQAPYDYYGNPPSGDAGPLVFGAETSDRFTIDGNELRVLYPLSEGTEIINVTSTGSGGLTLEKEFSVPVASSGN